MSKVFKNPKGHIISPQVIEKHAKLAVDERAKAKEARVKLTLENGNRWHKEGTSHTENLFYDMLAERHPHKLDETPLTKEQKHELKSRYHSQHLEQEQFSEPGQFYDVLSKHGYKQQAPGQYVKDKHAFSFLGPKLKGKWEHTGGGKGKNHIDLDQYLTKFHLSQHSEQEQPLVAKKIGVPIGHVTPERARELVASSERFRRNVSQ